jgi:hypothetical protein
MDRAEAIFARALGDLDARHGVKAGSIPPASLLALARAAMRAAEPFREANAELAGFPVRVAEGVSFWRLTFGASVWLDEAERVLPGGSKDPRYHKALIYALAHSRSPEAFPEVVTCKDLERLLKPFFRRLAATPEEVNAALDAVLGVGSAKPREEANSLAAADYAGICARLEGQTGVPAEEWMWKRSGKYAMKVYAELHSFARAYSARGGSFADMRDELDVATERLNLLKLEIAKSVKKGGGK